MHLGAIGIETAFSPGEWMKSSGTVKREVEGLNPRDGFQGGRSNPGGDGVPKALCFLDELMC